MSGWRERLAGILTGINPSYASKDGAGDWKLCAEGVFTEVELQNAYAKASGLPVMEEELLELPVRPFPGVPVEFFNFQCCLPYSWDEKNIMLLICDPYSADQQMIFWKQFHGLNAGFMLLRRSLLERLINDVYMAPPEAVPLEDEESLRSLASEAKVVRLVNEMFSQAVERRASDIHVEPEEDRLYIRFRIDGVMHEYLEAPASQYPAIASRIKLIGNLNIAETRLPQDGRTDIQLGRSAMDVRISTIPTMNGESIVLRLLKKDAVSFDLGVVGMDKAMQHDFEHLIGIPHGIILVVGPTGSGKSTTLYSVVTKLNDRTNKIITIEDPVEYKLAGLTQMQVNPGIGVTFASGLRSIVRQDPDIILVGEIRDRETADIAINAALTGHLVLSTLHTNDAAGAVGRLLDMGVENFLLASALYGVLSQRLVRKICTHCDGGAMKNGARCKQCGGTGFLGRTGIFELLVVNEDIRRAIIEKRSAGEIAAIAASHGMRPLIDDGMAKAEAGITTVAEVRRSATEL